MINSNSDIPAIVSSSSMEQDIPSSEYNVNTTATFLEASGHDYIKTLLVREDSSDTASTISELGISASTSGDIATVVNRKAFLDTRLLAINRAEEKVIRDLNDMQEQYRGRLKDITETAAELSRFDITIDCEEIDIYHPRLMLALETKLRKLHSALSHSIVKRHRLQALKAQVDREKRLIETMSEIEIDGIIKNDPKGDIISSEFGVDPQKFAELLRQKKSLYAIYRDLKSTVSLSAFYARYRRRKNLLEMLVGTKLYPVNPENRRKGSKRVKEQEPSEEDEEDPEDE